MLELLKLFGIFFKIGLFTFGGGYAMIPLIQQELVTEHAFISDEVLLDFIAISESTPGPFAINIATFVGIETHGFLGAIFTTLGIVMPSFFIILLIAIVGSKLIKTKWFKNILSGIKPCVIGLILGAGISISLKNIIPTLNLKSKYDFTGFDYLSLIIFITILIISRIKWKNKQTLSPVILIIISGVLGLIIFGLESIFN